MWPDGGQPGARAAAAGGGGPEEPLVAQKQQKQRRAQSGGRGSQRGGLEAGGQETGACRAESGPGKDGKLTTLPLGSQQPLPALPPQDWVQRGGIWGSGMWGRPGGCCKPREGGCSH